MAVIQISKIQIRRGTTLEEGGMPQLASGELGWSVDEQKLYIGNGSVAEGAPAVGNTEILTQFSTATINLFNSIYSYSVTSAGTWTNYPVERPLQQRLEDRVSVKDFGATGDGATDDTSAIQRAIKQLYVEETSSSYRKNLLFPAGIYKISDVIYLPDNVSLVGEGHSRSILRTEDPTRPIFQTRSTTGTNFLAQPAISATVTNVSIQSLGFNYTNSYNAGLASTSELLVLDQCRNSVVEDCSFQGTWTVRIPEILANFHYSGILVKGSLNENTIIRNNHFNGLMSGIRQVNDIKDNHILNNTFFNLRRAISSGDASTGTIVGPLRTLAKNNKFDRIQNEAIFVTRPITNTNTNINFISDNNIFLDVGNYGRGNQFEYTSVINFTSATGCLSINDVFTRYEGINTLFTATAPRPLVTAPTLTLVYPATRHILKQNVTAQTLARIPYSVTATSLTVDYIIEKTSRVRKGTLTINSSPSGVVYSDNYSYVGASDIEAVEMTAELRDTDINGQYDALVVKYRNPSNGTGTITVSMKSLH